MDRERAELHLRLLAEAELRRAGPALRDTAAQSPDIARVARVTQALTEGPQSFRTGDPIGFSPERDGIKCRESRKITLLNLRSKLLRGW